MIMAAIICMTVAFLALLSMLFLQRQGEGGILALVAFGMFGTWMAIILYWLTHFVGAL